MYDPSMRVLTVLELLQARGRLSGEELAARLEVSVRSVQRYIARLQDLGIPVESIRGPGGFYQLKRGFRMAPLMFSSEETFAVLLGLDALQVLGLKDITPAAEGAGAKLERILPPALQQDMNRLRGVLELVPSTWAVASQLSVLLQLAAATAASQCVAATYQNKHGEQRERVLEPLGLLQYQGRWFLGAFCHLRQARRLFRVDRFLRVETFDQHFAPPGFFDMHAFVLQHIRQDDALYEVELLLHMSREQLGQRLSIYGFRVKEVVDAEGQEMLRLSAEVSSLRQLGLELLALNAPFEVYRPTKLREALLTIAEGARLAAYPAELPASEA